MEKMRHIRRCLGMLSLCIMLSLVSCTIESSKNGDLDGFWHLERIDTLATGKTSDYSEKRIFWGIEHKLLYVKDADAGTRGYLLRFEQTSDSLKLSSPYKFNWHEDQGSDEEPGGDIPVKNVEPLRPFGLNALEEKFAKEALDGSKMILRSKTLRLYFKRF